MKSLSKKDINCIVVFGTTQTTVIVGVPQPDLSSDDETDSDQNDGINFLHILGSVRVSNRGAFKKGVVSSIDILANSIIEAVDEVERQTGLEITSIVACVSSLYSISDNYEHSVKISGREIQQSDISKLFDEVTQKQEGERDLECIHRLASNFTVDSRTGITNPIGMMGNVLSCTFHRIFIPKQELHSIAKACSQSGLRVKQFIFKPLAAALGVLTSEEKEYGCLCVCIGSFLTHVTVFSSGAPQYTKVFPIGSDYITRDLSIGLNTTHSEAERIKKEFGKAFEHSNQDSKETIEIRDLDEHSFKIISRLDMNKIIEPRVKEIFKMILEDLRKNKMYSRISRGAVLSGGGALLSGISVGASNVLGLHARIGKPVAIKGLTEGVRSPIWSSAVGCFSPDFSISSYNEKHNELDSPRIISMASKFWERIKESILSK